MTGKKTSLYMSEEMERIIKDMEPAFSDSSAAINAAVIRYMALLKGATPKLKENEWMALIDTLKDFHTNNIRQAANSLADSLRESYEKGLAEKWDLQDKEEFAALIGSLPLPARIAIIHVGEVFWGKTDIPVDSNKERLVACGAKIL